MLTFPALAVEVVESVTTHCQTAAIVSGAVPVAENVIAAAVVELGVTVPPLTLLQR